MPSTLLFGPFKLLPEQRLLLEGDRPVPLGSRAFEILVVLASRAGDLVTHDEIVSIVWPDTFVADANLRVHIGALRRVLGEGRAGTRYISNVPGRGYSFVAKVSKVSVAPHASVELQARTQSAVLPTPLTRVIGRESSVKTLTAQLPQRHFVTIVGPGGIGKTTVALAAAEALAASYGDGARFIDLARLADGKLTSATLAAELGLPAYSEDPLHSVLAHLRDKHLLIVLDNCEHIIDEAARLAEHVLRNAPRVNILATSREPLRADGEWVHRLSTLNVPPPDARPTAHEAIAYPAVQLFVERSVSGSDGFQLSDADAPVVSDICRRLDGMPLAIELAAATVDMFGVRGLAARLDNRLSILTRGRRTALPRHRTLRATLDWSYEILSEPERAVLRRLAVFVGSFTPECSGVIAADDRIPPGDVSDAVMNLTAKSLISVDATGESLRYRLLETTREYALEKLRASGESIGTYARHAEHYERLLRDERKWESPSSGAFRKHDNWIDNVRVALDWTFSPEGNASRGVSLAAAAAPLWMRFSLMQECRTWTQRALAAGAPLDRHIEMELQTALGYALMYTDGATAHTRSALESALQAAEALGDVDFQVRALWALCVLQLNNGLFREALTLAEQLHEAAEKSRDPADVAISDRMLGFSLYYLGDSAKARRHLERMLDRYPRPTPPSHIVRFQFDLRITAQLILAEILWTQGEPEQALRLVRASVDEAIALDHTITLCNALAKACPVALLAGELDIAERYANVLLQDATRNALASWQAEARCFLAVLKLRRGDLDEGIAALTQALATLPGISFSLRYSALYGELADALGHAGRVTEGMRAIEVALARADQHDERWCYPELLRIKNELRAKQINNGSA